MDEPMLRQRWVREMVMTVSRATLLLSVALTLQVTTTAAFPPAGPIRVCLTLAPGQDPGGDTRAHAAVEQIKRLLNHSSAWEALPGPVLCLQAPGWSAEIDREQRKRSLDALASSWGENIKIKIGLWEGGYSDPPPAGRAASVVATVSRAQRTLSERTAAFASGNQGAIYDGSAAKGSVAAAALRARPAVFGAGAALQAPAAPPASLARPASSGIDLAAIDAAVDPCADFFQYSCGGWLKSNPIPADESSWQLDWVLYERNLVVLKGILEEAASTPEGPDSEKRKLGDFYASCMDEEDLERLGASPLRPELQRISRLRTQRGLAPLLAHLHSIGISALFSFGSIQDVKDARRVIAGFAQGGLSLPGPYDADRDYYLDPNHATNLKAFEQHAAKLFALAGDSPDWARIAAARVVGVERELARIHLDLESMRDPLKAHNLMTRKRFEALTPSFDWRGYYAALGATPGDRVDVDLKFFSGLDRVLRSVPVNFWRSYLRWQLINNRASMLSSSFVEQDFEFYGRRMAGRQRQQPRWKNCVEIADAYMGDPLGRLYSERILDPRTRPATLALIDEVQAAMADTLQDNSWMRPATRGQALDKLSRIVKKVGHPDKWRDYSALEIAPDDFLGNVSRLSTLDDKEDLAKIGRPADRAVWGMTAPTVNAEYDPVNNHILLPGGTLQPPYYDPGADSAAFYGSLGTVIAHELTHAFDDEGSQYDGQGNLRNWWTPSDRRAFNARAQTLVAQYSSYVALKDPGGDPAKDLRVDGELTLGENIADNASVYVAYAAFQRARGASPGPALDGFTAEQRFFLGFAQIWCGHRTDEDTRLQTEIDPHAPNRFRVNGPLANMPEFGSAFSCKAGDDMVSPRPVRVW